MGMVVERQWSGKGAGWSRVLLHLLDREQEVVGQQPAASTTSTSSASTSTSSTSTASTSTSTFTALGASGGYRLRHLACELQ